MQDVFAFNEHTFKQLLSEAEAENRRRQKQLKD